MSGRNFAGLIIGGPRDGQWLEHFTDRWEMAMLPLSLIRRPLTEPSEIEETATVERLTYQHIRLTGAAEFWVLSKDVEHRNPVEFIFDRLVACYRPGKP